MVLGVRICVYIFIVGCSVKNLRSFSTNQNDSNKVEWTWAPKEENLNVDIKPEPGDIISEELTTVSTKLNCSDQIDQILRSIPSIDLEDSYDTVYSDGSRYLTVVKVTKIPDDDGDDLGKRVAEDRNIEKRLRISRVKSNQIFGSDNRARISPGNAQFSPHSSTALISCGPYCSWSCTGTLVGPRHVLTAAHCINKEPVKSIRVGFLQRRNTMNWYTADSFYVPHVWRGKRSSNKRSNVEYDYAIIKLSRSPGKTSIRMSSVPLTRRTSLSFSGFNARIKMYKSTCRPLSPPKSIIITQCDAVKGNSGAGILVHHGRRGYLVVGVLSARAQRQLVPGRTRSYMVASYLTNRKISQIKRWMSKP